MFIIRRRFLNQKKMVTGLQAAARGYLARKRFSALRQQKAALVIQRYYRGYRARKYCKLEMKKIITCQGAIRRFLARRQLKSMKIEARSLNHVKQLNKGLENKIISLQQRIEDMV